MGSADYWSPGDWNIICSICGTKLKFSQAVRNWQGMWRHPKCDEPRHPQDFVHARNAQEMAIPYPQYPGEAYINLNLQFVLRIIPSRVTAIYSDLATEASDTLLTEGLDDLIIEGSSSGLAIASPPDWVTPVAFAWSWQSGGAGIVISTPTLQSTTFIGSFSPATGIAQCTVVSSLGAVGVATVEVDL